MKTIVGRVLCPLLLAGVAASSAAAAEPRKVDLGYAVYIGGIDAVDVTIGLLLDDDSYRLDLTTEVSGLIRLVLPWSLQVRTEGRVRAAALVPDTAHTESTWRGKRRWTTLEFRDGLPAIVDSGPKPKRIEVPEEHLRGAIDATSAILTAARATARPGSCSIRVPVFDGRSRFDAVFEAFQEGTLRRTGHSAYSGKAVPCDLGIEVLHGRRKKSDYGGLAGGERTMTFWFARLFDGVQPLPVRIEHDTDLGGVIVHLTHARVDGPGGAREYRLPR